MEGTTSAYFIHNFRKQLPIFQSYKLVVVLKEFGRGGNILIMSLILNKHWSGYKTLMCRIQMLDKSFPKKEKSVRKKFIEICSAFYFCFKTNIDIFY